MATAAWAQQQATTPTAVSAAPISQAKRPLTYVAYDSWRSITGAKLAPSGAWAVYALSPQDGDGELVVRALASGATEWRVPRGTGGVFSPTEDFVVCTIAPTKAERDRAKRARRPAIGGTTVSAPPAAAGGPRANAAAGANALRSGMAIVPLATGKTQIVDKVKRWAVPEEGGRFLAYLMEDAPKPPAAVTPPAPSAPAATPAPAPNGGEATPTPPDANDFQQARGRGRGRQRAVGAPVAGTTAAGAAARVTGTDLVLYEFATGRTVSVPNVTDFGWNKNGSRLWVVTSAKDADKTGVFTCDAPDTSASSGPLVANLRPLKTGVNDYKTPVWDEAGEQIAFLAADKPVEKLAAVPVAGAAVAAPAGGEATPPPAAPPANPAPAAAPAVVPASPTPAAPLVYQLYLWQAASDGAKMAQSIVTKDTPGMPQNMGLSENASVFFSKSNARLYFGFAGLPKPKAAPPELVVDVDIWSSRDPLLQPMQKLRADSERKRSYQAVWHVKNKKMVVLGAPDLPDVRVDRDSDAPVVLATSDLLYQPLISWDGDFRDVYAVNVQTGERRKLLEKQGGPASLSPNGKYLLYFNEPEGAWYAMDTNAKKPAVNLTGKIPVKFADEQDDHPSFAPAYGSAGWTKNDETVLLYDRYDTWELSPAADKPARKITNGRAKEITFRLVDLDLDVAAVSTTDPLVFTATNDETKDTGLFRRSALDTPNANAVLEKLVMQNKQIGGIQKAKKGNALLMTWQRFEEYPNLWATTLNNPAQAVKISDANPQQKDFVWGKSELISYKSEDGVPLRAVLTRPDNFDPAKKYPLIVNIYERETDRLNYYSTPAPGTSINITRYASNGYFVLRPDIAYTPGYPGQSAQKCVLPAIAALVSQGNIDPARIGIQGHSWGAYQIAYLITRTNLFRAVEAGAAVADMISAYGGIRWGTGQSRAGQYEKGQSRIGATPWTKPLQFIENSPIFWVDKVQTPYLTIHNDADGAVPWYQGIEFFTALRRLNREAYMFDYNGEDHNLVGRDNQKHWTIHMDEFFDHYLLNKPRPDWMDKGVPYLDRGTRDVAAFYSTPPAAGGTANSAAQTSPSAPAAPLAPGGESKPVTGTTNAPPKK